MLADILTEPRSTRSAPLLMIGGWRRVPAIIATVSHTCSTWQRHHVRAEVLRVVRAYGVAHDVALTDRLTNTALSETYSVPHARVPDTDLGEPAALRRRDGTSVYRRHGVEVYTSRETLAAERRILIAVGRNDGRRATDVDVELALADSVARGRTSIPGRPRW